jgi:hypothetical protein
MAFNTITLTTRSIALAITLFLLVVVAMSNIVMAQNCGPTVGTSCGSTQCCSQYGYCGVTDAYCGAGCLPAYGICN